MRTQTLYVAWISALTIASASLPNPKDVAIGPFASDGPGCPNKSVSVSFSPNRTDLTFIMSQYQLAIGPATPSTQRTKGCAMQLSISYPPGFTFSFVNTTYRGTATLPRGVTASFTSQFRFLTNGVEFDDDFRYSAALAQVVGGDDSSPTVYTTTAIAEETRAGGYRAPCRGKATLNIMTRAALTASVVGVEASLGYQDDSPGLLQQVRLGWETC